MPRFVAAAPASGYSGTLLALSPSVYYRLNETLVVSAASSSTNFPTEPPANAFDGDPNTFWTTNGVSSGWLRAQLNTATAVTSYKITRRDDIPARNPKDWTFEGSNDGSTWTTLDTQTGITWPTAGETKSFTFTNSTAYTYYRVNVSANNGDTYLSIAELVVDPIGTAADSSGNSHPAKYLNATLGATGATSDSAKAVTFAGTGFIECPYGAWLNASSFTVAAFVKTTSSSVLSILDRCNGSLSFNGWQFRTTSAGKVELVLTHNGAGLGTSVVGGTSINDGSYHLVVGTYDGTTLKVYVDGSPDGSQANSGPVDQPLDGLRIGATRAGSGTGSPAQGWVGSLDEAAYWAGTALTSTQVAALYAAK